jgi:hypothetical protein
MQRWAKTPSGYPYSFAKSSPCPGCPAGEFLPCESWSKSNIAGFEEDILTTVG